ncbi:hypothetical protein LEUCIP111803_01886 [Leucobacter soli]|uniref:Aromatic ring-opening dioxygenase LigA n=2 Tax=Leucobacter soli TaxID=2812850 RepID=A0A916K0L8_9MICO|nr:hypothetical protein LEUCIP111803_01886 [Leucobacter soli]
MNRSYSAPEFRRVGGLAIAAGSILVAAGASAWGVVTRQLRDENITVPDHAPFLPGKRVQDPMTAFAQSEAIKGNAERIAGGRTFSDVSDALRKVEKGSDEEQRLKQQSETLSAAAALRTSLMTSVLAYGVAAFAAGLGVMLAAAGSQLRRAR